MNGSEGSMKSVTIHSIYGPWSKKMLKFRLLFIFIVNGKLTDV